MINGKRLKELRKKKGLTQKELGDIVGVSTSSISCYEVETRTPEVEVLINMVHFFGVSADYLLGTDCLIKTVVDEEIKYTTLTKEEVKFMQLLKKDKFIYDILLEDPKRGIEIIKNEIG